MLTESKKQDMYCYMNNITCSMPCQDIENKIRFSDFRYYCSAAAKPRCNLPAALGRTSQEGIFHIIIVIGIEI